MNTTEGIEQHIQNHIVKIIEASIQWMGLHKATSQVLAVLYMNKGITGKGLSAAEISKSINLSRTMISIVFTQLEPLGIIRRELYGNRGERGRRKTIYSLNVDIYYLLNLGIERYISEAERTLREVRSTKEGSSIERLIHRDIINNIEKEIATFLVDLSRFKLEGSLRDLVNYDFGTDSSLSG